MELRPLDLCVAAARALGHPARLRIVAMLRSGGLCVCQITEVLKLAPSTVSLHLKELKRAGIVVEQKDGRWVHVGLSEDPQARAWIETALAAVARDPQVDADRRMVARLRRLPVEDLCRFGYEKASAMRRRTREGGGARRTGSQGNRTSRRRHR